MTTFILEMVYSVTAEKIASAIGESVRPRYSGSPNDIDKLESLIIDGVNKVGGQASKGTTFNFGCSSNGVSVSDDSQQGTAVHLWLIAVLLHGLVTRPGHLLSHFEKYLR